MTFILHILRLVSRRLLRLIQLTLSTAKSGILSLWPIVRFLRSIYHHKNIYSEDQANLRSSGYGSVDVNKEEDTPVICHSHLPPLASIQAVHPITSTSEKPETDKHSVTTSEIVEEHGKDKLIIKTTSPSNLYRYDRKIKV